MKIWPFICEIRKKYDDYVGFFDLVLVDHLADLPIYKKPESKIYI